MKVALYRKFCHFAKMSTPPEDATLLLEGEGKDAPAEKAIKIGFLLDLIKDCGETKMPPMPIDEETPMPKACICDAAS